MKRGPNAIPAKLLHGAPTEKQVERMGDYFMASLGFESVHFSQPRRTMQTHGIPDRRYYHVLWGLALWWEAKREGGKQSEHQRRFQQMVEAVGEVYVLGGVDELATAAKLLMRHRAPEPPRPATIRGGGPPEAG